MRSRSGPGVAWLSIVIAVSAMLVPSRAHAQAGFTNYLDGSDLPGEKGWAVDQSTGTIVDLGGGNRGIQQVDADTGGNLGVHEASSYDEYFLTIFDTINTLAARFRLDSYSGSTTRINILELTAGGDASPGVGIGIRNVGVQDHWLLMRFLDESVAGSPADPATVLADLGPVGVGQFNEALLHIDNATDLVRASWNGVEVFNGITDPDYDFGGGEGYAEFGASNYWAEGGTSSVTFDWVGYGPGYIELPPIPEPGGAAVLLLVASATACSRRRRAA
jgi:hypothetical protein